MNSHQHARTTPVSRMIMIERRLQRHQSFQKIATDMGVSAQTVGKWVRRYQQEGAPGLQNRSSRPSRIPRQTPEATVAEILRLRRVRCCTAAIVTTVGVSPATVSRVLRRHKLHRRAALEGAAVVRYERETPGALVHLDVKKVPRFTEPGPFRNPYDPIRPKKGRLGFAFVFAAVDDHSRVAFAQILPNEQTASAITFLEAAVAWYRQQGVVVTAVMTDNGPCFKATRFTQACQQLGIRQTRTRPWRPQTNGKVERFNRTLSQEWVYAREYPSSADRDRVLPAFLTYYNEDRPHRGIGGAVPISRLGLTATTC